MRHFGLFIFALVSLMAHVVAASFFAPDPNLVLEEKGAGTASLEVGNLFDSAASEAVEPEPLKMAEATPPTMEPEPLRQAIAVKSFAEQPVPVKDLTPRKAVAVTDPMLRELTVNEALTQPDILKPKEVEVAALEELKPEEPPEEPDRIEAKKVEPSEIKPTVMETPELTKPVAAVKPIETKLVEPQPNQMTIPKQAPRPKIVPKKVKRKSQKPARKASIASRKGGAKASKNGRKNATGGQGGKKVGGTGTALTSNYKGKVISRIKRRAKYPSALNGSGIRGTPAVTFVLNRNGSISGLRLAGSSGNAKIDAAALKAVQRAAPFPAFPSSNRQASQRFTIRLSMKPRR